MKKLLIICILISVTNTFASSSYITIRKRCNENNLNNKQAKQRNQWAKKCFRSASNEIDYHNRQQPIEYALVSTQNEKNWNAPLSVKASCKKFTKLHAFCVASCYTPDQKVLFEDGYEQILRAFELRKTNVVSLTKDSSIDKLDYNIIPVESYTVSWRDSNEVIRVFQLSNGRTLKVTLNHPLLSFDGVMKKAKDFSEKDLLIDMDGNEVIIESFKDINYFGKVYNLAPDSIHPLENIIISQGVLNGSANYQYHVAFKDMYYKQTLRSLIEL